MWTRLEKPVYSRVRGGPTTFGLWGRVGMTAFVLAWLPWVHLGFVSVLYLLAYVPIASVLLWAIWRRDVVGRGDGSAAATERRLVERVRLGTAITGVVLTGAAAAAHASPLGYLPAGLIIAIAMFPPAARAFAEAIRDAQARPIGALIFLNGLNVFDLILSDAAIGAGVARELNPLVVAIGPVPKLIVVAASSLVLLWKRPDALVWPALVFLVLAAYHLTGLFANLGLA